MKKLRNYVASTPVILLGLLAISVQACSSSSSNGSGVEGVFSSPVSASTLQLALATGSSSDDGFEFWECTVGDEFTILKYRLLADGSGFETDSTNPAVQSKFTWVATSTTSIEALLETSGMQNNLTDIEFSDKDNMRMKTADNRALTCERKGASEDPVAPGNSALTYGGVVYGLTHGFEETFSYKPIERNDTHSTSDFSVADGPFSSTTIYVGFNPSQTLWRPDGIVWFQARLYSPGGDSFQSATFDYEPDSTEDNSPAVSGRYFFQKARLGVDIDQSGSIESESGELIDVVNGSITVDRVAGGSDATMSFDVTLADGVSLSGSFTGQFVRFDNN